MSQLWSSCYIISTDKIGFTTGDIFMPYLSIQTNKVINPSNMKGFIGLASKTVAKILQKPESYVMVALVDNVKMLFAGNDRACAYLQLKSLGLPEQLTEQLSASLCELLANSLDIDTDRVYVEFSSPDRHMWGWNKEAF